MEIVGAKDDLRPLQAAHQLLTLILQHKPLLLQSAGSSKRGGGGGEGEGGGAIGQ